MVNVNIPSFKIPSIHLIGGSLIISAALAISLVIDYNYQWQNRAALSIGTRIHQELEDYSKESEEHLYEIHLNALDQPKYYNRYAAFMDIRAAMIQLKMVYAETAADLLPLDRSSINQKLGTNFLPLQTLAEEEQLAYQKAYQLWQDLIVLEKAYPFSTSQSAQRKTFRKFFKGFSFPELANYSKAQSYWLLKKQELEVLEQLKTLENQLLKKIKRAKDHHYFIQSKTPQLAVNLGTPIKIEAKLLRGHPLQRAFVKVLDSDYSLVGKEGATYLQKKATAIGIQKDSISLEITNPLTGSKEVQSIPLQYYVHP